MTNTRRHTNEYTNEREDLRELRRRLRKLTHKEAHECKPCEVCKKREERKSRRRGMVKTMLKWVMGACFRLGYPLALVYAVIEGHIPMLT